MQAVGAPICAFVPSGSRRDARWYCAWIRPQDEGRALKELTRQDFGVYLPLHVDPRTRRIGPLFPGYLFVRFDVQRDAWGVIRSTRGVGGLICSVAGRPFPLPEAVIEDFIARTSARGVVDDPGPGPLPDYVTPIPSGTRVLLASGAMIGLAGICTWSDSKRVTLLMEILGRGVRVTIPRSRVEPV